MIPKEHITQMDIWAGPERIAEWLPKREDIPEDFWGENKYTEIIHKWFFSGAEDIVFMVKEGIDKSHALAHIKSCLMSFDPPHEWKIAGCAYLLSLWFEIK